jgi:hypothetical protein
MYAIRTSAKGNCPLLSHFFLGAGNCILGIGVPKWVWRGAAGEQQVSELAKRLRAEIAQPWGCGMEWGMRKASLRVVLALIALVVSIALARFQTPASRNIQELSGV